MLGRQSDDETDEERDPPAASGSVMKSRENESIQKQLPPDEKTPSSESSADADELRMDKVMERFKLFFAVADSTCCSKETGVTVRMPVKDKKIIELDINSMALFDERELIMYALPYNLGQEYENDQEYFFDGEALNFMRRLIGGYVHHAFNYSLRRFTRASGKLKPMKGRQGERNHAERRRRSGITSHEGTPSNSLSIKNKCILSISAPPRFPHAGSLRELTFAESLHGQVTQSASTLFTCFSEDIFLRFSSFEKCIFNIT